MFISTILNVVAPSATITRNIFPPPSKFDPARDMPDLTGQVIIVTGGNSGIGYESIKHLAAKNAKVYLTSRSLSRAKAAVDEIKKLVPNANVVPLQLDLADLRSVRKAAEEFLGLERNLHVLYNNAGIMNVPVSQLTAQGYDAQFGTNVLGTYFFTKLLIPALTAASHSGTKARIVTTTSALQSSAPSTPSGFDYTTLKDSPARTKTMKRWGANKAYGQSKLGDLTISQIFRQDYPSVASCAVHPGVIAATGLADKKGITAILFDAIFSPLEMGPVTQLYAGTSISAEEMDGKFFIPFARYDPVPPRALDPMNQQELRHWLEEQIQGF